MSNHMNDDKLNSLGDATTPAPSEAARRRALDAAMLAFDAEQKKARNPAQGKRVNVVRFGTGLRYHSTGSGSHPSHDSSRTTGVRKANAAVAPA